MSAIFKITFKDIQALDDNDARELVALLCKAELRRKGIGSAPVTWGGDQRAADGGIDVRVAIESSSSISGYIPKNSTVFQVKAETFPGTKISKELEPKGVLRPILFELSTENGAYIIVSTRDNCAPPALDSRIQTMTACLAKHGLEEKVDHHFYDSKRIADWVECHPSVLVWVLERIGRPLQGWRPYGDWAYFGVGDCSEYLLDEKAKVFPPKSDDPISVSNAIARLREDLRAPGKPVRLVGLSGVGKTRLVQALFDERVLAEVPCLDAGNVIFSDLSVVPTPHPILMLETLLDMAEDCALIVDNCSQELHSQLVQRVRRPGCQIRLLTVEYDIREELSDGTSFYRMEGSSAHVIRELLKRHYDVLSDLDIQKIVRLSDGNARVAFALASTSTEKGQLAQLRDDQLFDRLFHQKNSPNDELMRCAQAASLLYSFFADDEEDGSEVALLAEIAGVSIPAFQQQIMELQRRRLIQQRADWRALLPHAIANTLAARSLDARAAKTLIRKFFEREDERVARSFTRRIGLLHESPRAVALAKELIKPGSVIGNIKQQSTWSREMLENLAPLIQRPVLDLISAATKDASFISVSNPTRGHFARLLRSLAYEADLFDDAVSALLEFGLAEDENYWNESAREILQSLFYASLSGTMALPQQRSDFVKALAFSDDMAKQKLSLLLLRSGLEADYFSSHHSFEFGALRRSYGWSPTSLGDYQRWYGDLIELAGTIGMIRNPIGAEARTLLARAIHAFWWDESLASRITTIARALSGAVGWPEGWVSLRNMIRTNNERYTEASQEALRSLEREIAPRDLRQRIQARVMTKGLVSDADLDDLESGTKTGSARVLANAIEVERLGGEAAENGQLMLGLLPDLLSRELLPHAYQFGVGVGASGVSMSPILEGVRRLLMSAVVENVDLHFVKGVLVGLGRANPKEVEAFLDDVVTDEVWAKYYPGLQLETTLDDAAFDRLLKSLEAGVASSFEYAGLQMGQRAYAFSISQLRALMGALALLPRGLVVVVDILYMVVFGAKERSSSYQEELQRYVAEFVSTVDWNLLDLRDHDVLFHLEDVAEMAVSNGDSSRITSLTLGRLLKSESVREQLLAPQLGRILRPFFKENPIDALDAVFAETGEDFINRILLVDSDLLGESSLASVSSEAWGQWCIGGYEKYLFAAEECKLLELVEEPGRPGQRLCVSRVAKELLMSAPHKESVLQIYLRRMVPMSFSGPPAETLRQRYGLLESLNPTGDPKLNQIIEIAKASFLQRVANEEQREFEMHRRVGGAFE